jgi:pimeloyl-ACP methyl ester carboxylesterase
MRTLALALLTALASSVIWPRQPAAAFRLHSCVSWSTRELARCGTFRVLERRDGPANGRAISLRVMVLPARGSGVAPDPLVFFNGGPGLSTVAYASYASRALDALRATHDLLLVDMRGTGDTDDLACDLYLAGGRLAPYLQSMFPAHGVRDCAERLAHRADLTQYTTEIAAQDFDDVRAALHVDRVDLFGVSYGSRLALEYMRRFPTHVRRAVLLGVIPPEAPIARDMARGTEAALDSAFAACALDAVCHDAAPQPRQDIATLMKRLRTAPVEIRFWNTRRLSTERIALTPPAAAEFLWMDSYSPSALARVLPIVHQAVATGDYADLARHFERVSEARRAGRREGLMLSVLCAEDAPRLSLSDARDEQTLLGAPVVHALLTACARWPRGTPSLAFARRVVSNVPTLLMSGGRDPVSPPDLADSAALGLSKSEKYLDPEQGHADLDARGRARIAEFLTRP